MRDNPIRWHGTADIIIYMIMPVLTVICLTNAFVLTFQANILHENSKEFLKFWCLKLVRREDKRMIGACRLVGIHVGHYGFVNAQLGILICDDIVQNLVTLVLLETL